MPLSKADVTRVRAVILAVLVCYVVVGLALMCVMVVLCLVFGRVQTWKHDTAPKPRTVSILATSSELWENDKF